MLPAKPFLDDIPAVAANRRFLRATLVPGKLLAENPLLRLFRLTVFGIVLGGALLAAATSTVRYIRHAEVQPILEELAEHLPLELRALPDTLADAPWSAWISDLDSNIRARLARGDEESIVNWLLLGTSFTSQPRAVIDASALKDRQTAVGLGNLMSARADDLMRALASPGDDERRLFARRFLESNGFTVTTAVGIAETHDHLLGAVLRIAAEREGFTQELEAARQSGDAEAEIARRARLFHARGLSLETSLAPNYALEQSLAAMKMRGLLKAGVVKRVAIVGAGLDFAGEETGFDFYPLQTIQPFAVLDSLRRLRLAPAAGNPEIVVLDISPRIIDHITRIHEQAARGIGYMMHVPLARNVDWLPEFRQYWKQFGDRIGAAVAAPAPNAPAELADDRVIRIPASVARLVSVENLNIVTERIDKQPFDLIIATNVLVYYELLEQSLAMSNLQAMLKPGGFLLSNSVLPELESLVIEPADVLTTAYTRANDGDRIVWYQRSDGVLK